jgi:hypothetical protein
MISAERDLAAEVAAKKEAARLRFEAEAAAKAELAVRIASEKVAEEKKIADAARKLGQHEKEVAEAAVAAAKQHERDERISSEKAAVAEAERLRRRTAAEAAAAVAVEAIHILISAKPSISSQEHSWYEGSIINMKFDSFRRYNPLKGVARRKKTKTLRFHLPLTMKPLPIATAISIDNDEETHGQHPEGTPLPDSMVSSFEYPPPLFIVEELTE